MKVTEAEILDAIAKTESRTCPCGEPEYAKGLCTRHYQRAKRHNGDPQFDKPFRVASYDGKTCIKCGAERPAAREMCLNCYHRALLRGELEGTKPHRRAYRTGTL